MTPNCRGCYALGLACGQCDRCHRERAALWKWADSDLDELERNLRAKGALEAAWMIAAIHARRVRSTTTAEGFKRKVRAW
jgi:hypothetical protein